MNKAEILMERTIFASRWIQAPMYLGLIVAGFLYAYKFSVELIHLCIEVNHLTEEVLMLGMLTLVDITMVANLLVMVIVGGYSTFVSRLDIDKHPDRPDWLEKVNAGTLKVKLAASLVAVSGIHLLKSFVNIADKNPEHVMWQVIIHGVFLVSALVLALTEKILKEKK